MVVAEVDVHHGVGAEMLEQVDGDVGCGLGLLGQHHALGPDAEGDRSAGFDARGCPFPACPPASA